MIGCSQTFSYNGFYYYYLLQLLPIFWSDIIRIQFFQILKTACQYKMQSKGQKHTKYTVCVRIKPNLSNEPTCLQPFKSRFIRQKRPKSIVTYCFDRVFQQTHTNQHIYSQNLRNRVQLFLEGRINTTILAYGQTGSGKTFTLFGSKSKQQSGLVDLMIEDITNFMQVKKISARCSFMQIYKERVSDLLTGSNVQLLENGNGELQLEGLNVCQVKTKEELIQLLARAHSNKIFGNSYINSQSSRSHVVFTIELQKRRLNIVDLCGSQVLTYKFNEQQRDQTNSINLSLFTLNSVVSDLAFAQKGKFIAFRNSVLTRILKESLLEMEKSQIYLFCNISAQQRHQAFSVSTLRFGQLAIQIDEAENVQEERVNLSQQKRDKKVVSNIVDITPETNRVPAPRIKWKTGIVKIQSKNTKLYSFDCEYPQSIVLLLHAYGYGCNGEDWDLHVSYLLKKIRVQVYSVDLPGFGQSQGKKFTSRAQKFGEKQQALQFMRGLFQQLGISKARKIILMGYDLGGAIALSCALDKTLSKSIQSVVAFHPTWTDQLERLSQISLPTLLLWMPVETFHLVSAGQKMAKLIKNSRLVKLNIGPYTNEKAGGYYDSYSEAMQGIVAQFIKENKKNQVEVSGEGPGNRERGRVVQENIENSLSQQEDLLIRNRQAVREVLRLKQEGNIKDVYESLIKGGPNKPKYVRLASELPQIKLLTLDWQFCLKYMLFSKLPKKVTDLNGISFLIPGQQLQIYAKINLNSLSSKQQYLAYDNQGQTGITHKAYVSEEQSQESILESQKVKVYILNVKGDKQQIQVPLSQILYLNSPTVYKRNNLGSLIFEDSVNCNYNSNLVKLKLVQCCQQLQPLIIEMDFSSNTQSLLETQKACTRIIYEQMNLKHLVHEGIDNTRYTGTDVGRLAYYGQGNCHHLASVAAALLLPFGKLLGWDVIFRAGSYFKQGRELDDKGQPLQQWNGKPKINVQDHTWLQLRYKPSNKVFVFDPSFGICSVPLDQIYSFEGRMHISGKALNFALDFEVPEKIWSN